MTLNRFFILIYTCQCIYDMDLFTCTCATPIQMQHILYNTTKSSHTLRLVSWAGRGPAASRRFFGRCAVRNPSSIAPSAATSSLSMAAAVLLDSGERSERPPRSPGIYVYFFDAGPSRRGVAWALYALLSFASSSCMGMSIKWPLLVPTSGLHHCKHHD
jgi:hypothetical protein